MNPLRETAQQALEALNSIDVGYRSPSGSPLEVSFDEGKCEAAIAALRAALAQQAEPVEGPVAVVATQSDVWRGYNGQWAPPGEPIKMVQMLRDLPTGTLLYTAPPQRRPLSEVDLRALYDRHAACQEEGPEISGWWDFARAVERAHGIKE